MIDPSQFPPNITAPGMFGWTPRTNAPLSGSFGYGNQTGSIPPPMVINQPALPAPTTEPIPPNTQQSDAAMSNSPIKGAIFCKRFGGLVQIY
jgi:hypothetical protein